MIAFLDRIGARYLASEVAVPEPDGSILFLLDSGDHIIARDFSLEVPEFAHEPGWISVGEDEER